MAYKVHEGIKHSLRDQWEKACNGYLFELHNLWDWQACYGFWVSDAVGGVYCYGDETSINMGDIIYCVENNIPQIVYDGYLEYCCKCAEYSFTAPNFESFHKGCPIVPKETFERLDALKKQMNECINETKSKF